MNDVRDTGLASPLRDSANFAILVTVIPDSASVEILFDNKHDEVTHSLSECFFVSQKRTVRRSLLTE